MNDLVFLQELAAVLVGDAYAALRDSLRVVPDPAHPPDPPNPPQIFAAQAAANTERPILVLSAPAAFTTYGPRRIGNVSFELRGRTGDETAAGEHQARFVLLWAAFFGVQGADDAATKANAVTAKAALIAALGDRGKITLVDYGLPNESALLADVDGDDLRTVLQLRTAWAFTPPV